MKVMVIGINGFLGRSLARLCLERSWRVHGVYHKNLELIPSDCRSFPAEELESLNLEYDIIFLTASHIPYNNMNQVSEHLVDANVSLPLKVVRKYESVPKLVFISSVSVYGQPMGIISETSPFNNPTSYGLSKLAGEFIMKFHANSSVIRLSSLYGPGMYPHTFLPKIITHAKNSGEIRLLGDGSRKQDYIHVSDAATLCILCGLNGKKNSIYLGVSGKSHSNLEVGRIVQKQIPDVKILFEGTDSTRSFQYNNQFTREELHFTPEYTLESGIKEMVENNG